MSLGPKAYQGCLIAISVCLLNASPVIGQDVFGDSEILSRASEAWQRRTRLIKTLQTKWSERSVMASENGSPMRSDLLVQLSLGPSGETLLESFPASGSNRRLMAAAFSGRKNYSFTAPIEVDDWPRGIVWSDDNNDEGRNVQLRPWLFLVRPFAHPVPNLSEETLKVFVSNVELNGHRCAVLESGTHGQTFVERYWIDMQRDYIVLRYTEVFNGQTTVELNIDYAPDQTVSWIPVSWEVAFANNAYKASCKLIDVEFNPVLTKSHFEIRFDPGTIVFDRDAGTRSLIRENKPDRLITNHESEIGFTYAELKATESGDIGKAGNSRRPSVLLVVLGAGVLAIGYFYIIMRLKR